MGDDVVDLGQHLVEEGDENLGFGGFNAGESKVINVLLIGRSQSGKSAIVQAIRNPRVGMTAKGFSETRLPKCHHLLLTDESNRNMPFSLNIIDTPGLKEARRDGRDRTDKELLGLAGMFLQESITRLNVVCFVTKAGQTHLIDAEVFDDLMIFLGPSFSECSMMVLTNCDKFSDAKLKTIANDIKDHVRTQKIYGFCKLGVYFAGIADIDDFDTQEENQQAAWLRGKFRKLAVYRKTLLSAITKRADVSLPLNALSEIFKKAEDDKREFEEKVNQRAMKKLEEERTKGTLALPGSGCTVT